jgi:hypothetical protein
MNVSREMYRSRMSQDEVFRYLEQNLPPVEMEDGRLITFGDWVTDYITRKVDEGIRSYLGGRW